MLLIFVPLELAFFKMIFCYKGALEITQNGFKYNCLFSNKKEILWKEINKIELVNNNYHTLIGISFYDNDKYINSLTLLNRYMANLIFKKNTYPIMLSEPPYVNIKINDLYLLLKENYKENLDV